MPTPQKRPSEGFSLRIDQRQLAGAYAAGAYEEALKLMVDWLSRFGKLKVVNPFTKTQLEALDTTAEAFAYFLTRPDFKYRATDLLRVLNQHQTLTNVFAMSSYRNTDSWLKPLLARGRPSLPLSLLANVRNSVLPDRKGLFDQHPLVASEWYGQFLVGARGFPARVVQENLRDHLRFWDDRMQLRVAVSNGYMRSTYIDPELDRVFKSRFNALVRRQMGGLPIRNRPRGNRIAMITGRWAPGHPTYKNRFPFFKALSEQYDLCLVHVGGKHPELEASIFSKVYNVRFQGMKLHSDFLFDNDFAMAFYPDIGMNVESRFLSNLRLAPIQITTNSHPVSTFGSEIDFFLTGAESEQSPEQAATHYSERLVLIPGIGTRPVVPTYIPSRQEPADGALYIGCPWGSLKFNHDILQALVRIKAAAVRPVKFRFLATLDATQGHYLPFKRDLERILGAGHVELYANLPYPKYMDRLAECAFALDPFPFGGNTSIVDCMALKMPIVARRGWQFYNLAGPVMLEKFGLGALAVNTEDEYVQLAIRLIAEPDLRTAIVRPLEGAHVADKLAELSQTDKFMEAMTYLLERRPDPKDRTPLQFI